MPREIITLQVGQAGNQIGWRFWDQVLREHAAPSSTPSLAWNDCLSTFFSIEREDGPGIRTGLRLASGGRAAAGAAPARLRARAILVDMEEGVVNQVLRSPLGDLFDRQTGLISDVSGAGNNWAQGYSYYGPRYQGRILGLVRRALEGCDSPQSFFLLHSTGGGTGSGLGSYILESLADAFPELYRFTASVFPSAADDVITSPYNFALTFNKLMEHADCVLPIENQGLIDIVSNVEAGIGKAAAAALRARTGSSGDASSGGSSLAKALLQSSLCYVPPPPVAISDLWKHGGNSGSSETASVASSAPRRGGGAGDVGVGRGGVGGAARATPAAPAAKPAAAPAAPPPSSSISSLLTSAADAAIDKALAVATTQPKGGAGAAPARGAAAATTGTGAAATSRLSGVARPASAATPVQLGPAPSSSTSRLPAAPRSAARRPATLGSASVGILPGLAAPAPKRNTATVTGKTMVGGGAGAALRPGVAGRATGTAAAGGAMKAAATTTTAAATAGARGGTAAARATTADTSRLVQKQPAAVTQQEEEKAVDEAEVEEPAPVPADDGSRWGTADVEDGQSKDHRSDDGYEEQERRYDAEDNDEDDGEDGEEAGDATSSGRRGTAWDSLNNVAAHLLTHLTASMRFEGPLNIDLNEITTTLVPFPRLHILQAGLAPLFTPPSPLSGDVGAGSGGGGGVSVSRHVDAMFSEAFSRGHQVMRGDPRRAVHMACGLFYRGDAPLSDVNRNVERLRKDLRMASWNPDGFKVGICATRALHQPHSLLALSNNTSIVPTLSAAFDRFSHLYRVRAHAHHYTDLMGEDIFREAATTLRDTISSYNEIDAEGDA